ncbi:MAG: hypothetical protein IJS78_05035 [Clostridia bacterium]|nr:hypothetical protein [Clostridia bacterium]
MDGSGKDIGEVLGKLMSDPQFASLVRRMKEDDKKEEDAAPQSAETPAADGSPAEGGGDGGAPEGREALEGVIDSLGPILRSGGGESGSTANRNRLLSALKPYVSRERRDLIDKVTSISKLTSILDSAQKGRDR